METRVTKSGDAGRNNIGGGSSREQRRPSKMIVGLDGDCRHVERDAGGARDLDKVQRPLAGDRPSRKPRPVGPDRAGVAEQYRPGLACTRRPIAAGARGSLAKSARIERHHSEAALQSSLDRGTIASRHKGYRTSFDRRHDYDHGHADARLGLDAPKLGLPTTIFYMRN